MALRVLVCDDEELIRWSLREHLVAEGYLVEEARDGEECVEKVTASAPDAVLLDLNMPRLDGITALRRLREADVNVPVLVITAHGAVESAVEATRLGAVAYLSKPFDLREVSLQLERAIAQHRLSQEVRHLRDRQREGYGKLIGQSPSIVHVFDVLSRLEDVDAPTVLVQGESGTGKDLVAQTIHSQGPRADAPFMEVDCASLPEQLIESTLFGHEKGAFTDARTTKRGLFEVARGGTIFLDEIGEMAPGMQAKLLRALENRRFKRVGGLVDITLDASVVAATNRDLKKDVVAGRFREDLYFRLGVIIIDVPPLRDRPQDVPLLVDHFLRHFNRRMPRPVEGISEEALQAMQRYEWPGNVRELRNVIERILILERDATIIRRDHLPPEIRRRAGQAAVPGQAAPTFVLPEGGVNLEELELSLLMQALERTEGNQSRAARLLGISRYALRYRMEKHDLLPSRSNDQA
ncbi:MAG: sigma-54-dependent Fis family transcriptional regulator [Deltaproteobacteria bacterium]|nr:sigma-54-dependent Fis family transcriptional regulator [Deltaproteobacteria bacterium]MCB9787184.1 sigma-54-dependent Fis family transcriptional regulator [Deltaproteobacteria bacterium]